MMEDNSDFNGVRGGGAWKILKINEGVELK